MGTGSVNPTQDEPFVPFGAFVIEYRRFQNADPPRLIELWHAAHLGRGAAIDFPADAFEQFVFSQPYFDRDGLIVAVDSDSGRVIGMGHAGFGPNDQKAGLSQHIGVICAIMVHPEFRRRNIGRELVDRLEGYLKLRGAETILAGPAAPFDPFYVGLYGGSRPSGFLESDADAGPFFLALGYEPAERFIVLQRDLQSGRDPMNFRMVNIRRQTELSLANDQEDTSWWWMTRYGRLDSLRFQLADKADKTALAAVTIIGLDLYLPRWRERVIGLLDLEVPEQSRQHGYGQALLLEIAKRLRSEFVSRLEAHVSESNQAALRTFESAGFEAIDNGVVYRKGIS